MSEIQKSRARVLQCMPPRSVQELKADPMLFAADFDFARTHAGLGTHHFISALPPSWQTDPSLIIDSRTHMLMPGWWPCIPGWHTDDVPRPPSYFNGQPDIFDPGYRSEHIMVVYEAADAPTGSLTEFLLGDFDIPRAYVESEMANGIALYKVADDIIEARRVEGFYDPKSFTYVQPNTAVRFDWQSWHRGMPATRTGWRMFIRATIKSPRPHFNELRKQTQVYLADPTLGW